MNTADHHKQWTRESRLRDQKISFVSAGTVAPLEEAQIDQGNINVLVDDDQLDSDLEGSEGAMAQMNIQSSAEQTMSESESAYKEVDMEIDIPSTNPVHHEEAASTTATEEPPAFFIDTEGDASLAVNGPPVTFRASSPARSDSSGEVLFRGRRGPITVRDDPPQQQPKKQSQRPAKQRQLSALASTFSPTPAAAATPPAVSALVPAPPAATADEDHVTNALMRALDGQLDDSSSRAPLSWLENVRPGKEEPKQWQHADGVVSDRGPVWPAVQPEPRLDEDLSGIKASSRKSKKGRKKQNKIFRLKSDLEDELLQDYIDNMDAEERQAMLGGAAGSSQDSTDELFDQLLDQKEVDTAHMTGVDEIDDARSTQNGSDDDEWEDEDDDDAEDDDEDMDSSELEEQLEYTEREQWEDEEDLRQRHMDSMTDEEIARIFAKQEELGLQGDEILLFDEGFGDVGAARAGLDHISGTAGLGSRSRNKNGMRRPKRGRKSDQFPDAGLMADVLEQDPYGGFDIMDFERPSLKAKPKGRKSAGALPEELLALSDDDLRDNLSNQWANDRSKKASRKAEREELRQLGLLSSGKKNKFKSDLSVKYQEGITMAQVRVEFREFLEDSDNDTRAFPPMLKNDRKILHEMANHFNLKSKSVGSGKNRAPVLIKSQRTLEWDEARFARAQGFISRGYLKNPGSKKAGGSKAAGFAQARKGRMAGGGGAASYANGDVVGGSAPEIGASNFGRKLMEKMGWTAGMALGKEGNVGGLLVPVQATIKSGKAGLG